MRCSVVTVCLNAETYLRHQLKTVAEQNWHDVEQVVVDGGSTDGTLDIIHGGMRGHPRLVWSSGQDGGISDAMNRGLALSTGEIVAFLHADDYYPDAEVLRRVTTSFIEHPDAEWLTGGVQYVNQEGQVLRNYSPRRWSYRRLLRGNILFHPATFVRRQVLDLVGGFDTALRFTMDYDLWLRLGKRSTPLQLDRPLACFRVHPQSTSVRLVNQAFREELHVRFRYLEGKPLQKVLHFLYFVFKFLPNCMSVRS